MLWTTISLFVLRIALPLSVGFGLRILIEDWQKNRAAVAKRNVLRT